MCALNSRVISHGIRRIAHTKSAVSSDAGTLEPALDYDACALLRRIPQRTSTPGCRAVVSQCRLAIACVCVSQPDSMPFALRAPAPARCAKALAPVPRASRVVARAETAEKTESKPWSPPELDASTPSPIFGGSTGGLLRKAQVRPCALSHFPCVGDLTHCASGCCATRSCSAARSLPLQGQRTQHCAALPLRLRTVAPTPHAELHQLLTRALASAAALATAARVRANASAPGLQRRCPRSCR